MHASPPRRSQRILFASCSCGLLVAGAALVAAARPAAGQAPAAPPAEAGVNARFLDPGLDPAEWVERFEVESREIFAARETIVAAVGLESGQALVPGGELVIIDFERIPGVSRDWLLEHVRAGKETVREEIEMAGFDFLEEVEVPAFKENYLLRFRTSASP